MAGWTAVVLVEVENIFFDSAVSLFFAVKLAVPSSPRGPVSFEARSRRPEWSKKPKSPAKKMLVFRSRQKLVMFPMK